MSEEQQPQSPSPEVDTTQEPKTPPPAEPTKEIKPASAGGGTDAGGDPADKAKT